MLGVQRRRKDEELSEFQKLKEVDLNKDLEKRKLFNPEARDLFLTPDWRSVHSLS